MGLRESINKELPHLMERAWEETKIGAAKTAEIAKVVAKKAALKAEEVAKMTQKQYSILMLKREIAQNFTEIGGLVYTAYSKGLKGRLPTNAKLEKIVDRTKRLEQDLKRVQAQSTK